MSNASPIVEPVLDHVVINALGQLDEAAKQYRRLGFTLTERGHHTLGSSNNLAIFGTDYLELLGFLPGRQAQRADLWLHPPGLTGLVFKAIDPATVYAAMQSRGVPVAEPMQFARPVLQPQGTRDARFSVVRVTGDVIENGRTYFCHHFTPELVWQPQWQEHANGVTGIAQFVIAARDPVRTAAIYERMFGPDLLSRVPGGVSLRAGGPTVLVLDPETVTERYAGAALTSSDKGDRMVALTFKSRSLDATRSALQHSGVPFRPLPGGGIIVPHEHAAQVALAFVE
jgi:hypothetical protein